MSLMMKKHVLLAISMIMALGLAGQAAAQGHLAVELQHPVYAAIEAAEMRGVVARLSSVKPYTSRQIAELLATMMGHPEAFSSAEQGMIRRWFEEFSSGKGIEDAILKDAGTGARVGLRFESTTRLDAGGYWDLLDGAGTAEPKDLWSFNSRIVPYIAGDPVPWLSLKGEAGFTFDKIEYNSANLKKGLYLPYEFTKEWDANHIWFGEPRYSLGDLEYPTLSYDIRQDIAAETDSGSLMVRFSRFRRDWGVGVGSFSLSGTARPFVATEVQFQPSRYFAVTSLLGSLTNWQKGGQESSTAQKLYDRDGDGIFEPADGDYYYFSAISWQKMLGLQRMELFPFDWLALSATSTLVGAKRFEPGYMAPLLFSVMYQNQLADIDNLGVQIDGKAIIPSIATLYGSFYADEMEITNLSELFTKARNMFALQGGAKIRLPGVPFGMLTAQYTKIEPFVYSHYPTWYPDYRMRVDTSYTQDGENLGYYLPPNSDELLVKLDAMPADGFRIGIRYAFVRHGDNPWSDWNAGLPRIYGDPYKYMDYKKLTQYNKDFLHDGIYDYNHIGRVEVAWRPVAPRMFGMPVPFELGAAFGLSYTWWKDELGLERAVNEPVWKQILAVSCKVFL